jgi:hypothetical protein
MISRQITVDKKFAWFPIITDSGTRVWLSSYYVIGVFKSVDMRHRWINYERYTAHEYFLKKMSESS